MGIDIGPIETTDGLVLHLDAGNTRSYPGSGNTVYDLSGFGNTSALTNGPTYNSSNLGAFVLDGSNDYILDNSPITIEIREFPESNDSKCKNKKLEKITIYCENDNCPACACYRKVFSQYQVEGVAEVKRNKPITRFTINL